MDKKRKVTGLLFTAFLVLSVTWLGFKILDHKETQKEAGENTKTLSRIAGKIPITLKEYIKPTLLIYMNSECEHCQWQLRELVKIEKELESVQVILVSIEPLDSLHNFLAGIPFQKAELFKPCEIPPEKVREVFGSTGTPQVFIYMENQLVKHFTGEVRVGLLTEIFNLNKNVTQKTK